MSYIIFIILLFYEAHSVSSEQEMWQSPIYKTYISGDEWVSLPLPMSMGETRVWTVKYHISWYILPAMH
jgi:hypothetical protein